MMIRSLDESLAHLSRLSAIPFMNGFSTSAAAAGYGEAMISAPRMWGRSTPGTTTEPSGWR
jgi:hypothetical protein